MRVRSSEDLTEKESDNEREGRGETKSLRERQPEGQQYREIMWRKMEDRCREAQMMSNRKEATKEQ